MGGEQQEGRDGGGIVGAHIIATYKIRDQHQLDRNYKLPSCKQQPASGIAPPSVTVSKSKMFSCCIFGFYLFQLRRDRCYFRISHSNSNSLLSGLDFLGLTSPKMPPRCLLTQLHGESRVLPPSLSVWNRNENIAAQPHKNPDSELSLSGDTHKVPVILLVSVAVSSCGSGLLR